MKKSRKDPIFIECTGEAHQNPFIDNCWICAPYWGNYPACPHCQRKLTMTTKRYICNQCNLHFGKIK